MIFADKLILLRKKAGWSQEELADQMNVTRQSVSKWEGAQSVPDLEKMLRLSELFGVSTDYLLKDEIEEAEHIDSSDDTPSLRRVSMEEANAFLSVKLRTAKTIAYAAFLCILSPIALLILSAISESTAGVLNENIANGIGMIVLIILVAIAAVMFISSGSKTAPFAYLEKEKFETEYGVSGMVKERKTQYKDLHTKNNIAGTCLCIAALIPLFIGAIINADSDLFLTIMLSLSFLIAGVGVICFIKTGIIWASYEKLLKELQKALEDTPTNKCCPRGLDLEGIRSTLNSLIDFSGSTISHDVINQFVYMVTPTSDTTFDWYVNLNGTADVKATFTAEGRKKSCIIKLEEIEKISSLHRKENEDNAHLIKNPIVFAFLHRLLLRNSANKKMMQVA